mmetsp:Transcript_9878/g.18703  ORF Transcript_9878/g.18703 Transcript_9878/m.18703 type:complete len:436 (-) Transcript_9878:19-1326(-)
MAQVPERTKVEDADEDGVVESGDGAGEDVDNSDQVDKDGWLHLMEGTIKKRVLKAGSGQNPEMNQDVVCSFRIRLAAAAEDALLQVHEKVRYRIGEGEAVPCLELCLRHMVEGEESEVWSISRMAWGPEGLLAGGSASETAVPADADVVVNVVLHQCLPSATSWNERIQELNWRKENGNFYFRRKQFMKAGRSYAAGLDVFKGGFEAPEDMPDAGAASSAAAILCGDVGANLSAVHLALGNATAARDAATAALSVNTNNVKALYRGAKACFLLDEFDECEVALQRALALEPEDASLLRLDADFKRKKVKYANKSKRLAEKAVKACEYEDREVHVGDKEPNGQQQSMLQELEAAFGDKELNGQQRSMLQDFGHWVRSRCRYFAAATVIINLLLVLLAVLPRKHWPHCCIVAVLGLPTISAMLSRREDGPDVEKKRA